MFCRRVGGGIIWEQDCTRTHLSLGETVMKIALCRYGLLRMGRGDKKTIKNFTSGLGVCEQFYKGQSLDE